MVGQRSRFWMLTAWSSVHERWVSLAWSDRRLRVSRLYERHRETLPLHLKVVPLKDSSDAAQDAVCLALPPPVDDDLYSFDGVFDRQIVRRGGC